jgi:hypothetical protein
MKKHYILLSIKVPLSQLHEAQSDWRTFWSKVEPYEKKATKIERLAENCWLIPRDSELSFLAQCIVEADELKISYSIRFLDEH